MKQKDEEIWIMTESRYGVIDAMEREIASCSTSGSHFVILCRSSHELQQRMHNLNEDSLSLLARFTVNHTISDDLLYELTFEGLIESDFIADESEASILILTHETDI
ncbi:hypothetical protein ACTFIW_003740 [Dictyostelium discoideum]